LGNSAPLTILKLSVEKACFREVALGGLGMLCGIEQGGRFFRRLIDYSLRQNFSVVSLLGCCFVYGQPVHDCFLLAKGYSFLVPLCPLDAANPDLLLQHQNPLNLQHFFHHRKMR